MAREWEDRNQSTRGPYLRRKALEWYHANHSRALQNIRSYYRKNKAKKNALRNQQMKRARRTDPGIRARYNFRVRLSNLIRKVGLKTFSVSKQAILYTADELRKHLELQFVNGMSWENYSTAWEIDHIIPCSHFRLTEVAQARQCFALANLRPLAVDQNRARYYTEARTRKTNHDTIND